MEGEIPRMLTRDLHTERLAIMSLQNLDLPARTQSGTISLTDSPSHLPASESAQSPAEVSLPVATEHSQPLSVASTEPTCYDRLVQESNSTSEFTCDPAPSLSSIPGRSEDASTENASSTIPSKHNCAQALFRKCNIKFDHRGWLDRCKKQIERVQKPIKMRVKHTCHECKVTFGRNRNCVECAHQRCRECPRYPPRKRKARTEKPAAVAVSEKPVGHVGACHECQTRLDHESLFCTNCHHTICERCLHEVVEDFDGDSPAYAMISPSVVISPANAAD